MFEHFLEAQAPVYQAVLTELRDGRKRSHWMWFIFPQITGLGTSPTSRRFALHSLDEASAYLNHAILGTRLRECTAAVLVHSGKHSAHSIFGSPDDLKLRSSMTLFAHAAKGEGLFKQTLDGFFAGVEDEATLARIR